MSENIVRRLREWADLPARTVRDIAAYRLMDEAAEEIKRLQKRIADAKAMAKMLDIDLGDE